MMYKTVRVREDTYRKLNELAAKLRERLGRPVSMDEVIRRLLMAKRPSELAGAWNMSEEEEEAVREALRELRSRWRPRTA